LEQAQQPRKKVLILQRVSTTQQKIEQQEFATQEICEQFSLEPAKVYSFPGESGMIVQETPEFKDMMKALEQPDIAGLVVMHPDRMFRPEYPDAYRNLAPFRIHKKVIFTFRERPVEIWKKEDRDWIVDTLEKAADERVSIRRRTYPVKERLAKDPLCNVFKLPKGVIHIKDEHLYGRGTKKGHFEFDGFAHNKVKLAFEMVANGSSIRHAATVLGFSSETALRVVLDNKWWIGIKERTHKRIAEYVSESEAVNGLTMGDRKRTKKGTPKFSRRMEHDAPICHHTNLSVTPDVAFEPYLAQPNVQHNQPLVSPELFQKVQDLISVYRNSWTQNRSNTNKFLGTKFLYCQCGAKLYVKNDGRQKATFYCSKKCGFKRLRAEPTDKAIWTAALIYFTDQQNLTRIITQAQNSDEAQARQNAITQAQTRLTELENEYRIISRNMLKIDAESDPIRYEVADRECKRLNLELSETRIRLATARAQGEPFGTNDVAVIVDAILRRFCLPHKWTAEEKISALSEVVERIEVNDRAIARFVIRGGLPVYNLGKPIPTQLNGHEYGTESFSEEWNAKFQRLS